MPQEQLFLIIDLAPRCVAINCIQRQLGYASRA